MQGNFLSFLVIVAQARLQLLQFSEIFYGQYRVWHYVKTNFYHARLTFKLRKHSRGSLIKPPLTSLRLRINIIWIFNARILLQHLNTFTYVKNFPRLPYQNFLKPFTILWLETDWRFSIFLFAHQRHVIHEYTTDFFLLVLFYFRFWKNR